MTDLISRRLRHAREIRGFTQAQLSEKLGFKDRQTIAAIEAGERKLTAEELVRAMQVLGLELDFFTDSFSLAGEGKFTWRADNDAKADALARFEEQAGRWIATYRKLGEEQGQRVPILQYRLALTERNSFEQAVAAGEQLGADWQLGDQPALKLESAIRARFGALVLYVDAPEGISGSACQAPGVNAILINRNELEGRRHFNLAHECFHLLTWEQMQPEHREAVEGDYRGKGRHKRIEQLADNFAAALLVPERALAPLWQARGKQDINSWLNRTATTFLVSAKALKWRVVNLGWLSKEHQAAIDDEKLTANGRPRKEQSRPKPFSQDFVSRIHTALSKGKLSVRRAASLLGLTIQDLADLFRDYGLPVPFDL
jgi:Zn-dependent peptidase ImmA (M78 family)/transcriptional regulator with XRE-family HTH domain